MSMHGLATIEKFSILVEEGKFQEAATECLVDDFFFSNPKTTFKSKDEWLKRFPGFIGKNKGPQFGEPEIVEDSAEEEGCTEFVRRGKVKLLGIGFSVVENIVVNSDGKIVSMKLKKS